MNDDLTDLTPGVDLQLTGDVSTYQKIEIYCFAIFNNTYDNTRKFCIFDNNRYLSSDKGVSTRHIGGGIFYSPDYYAYIGFSVSADGKTLRVEEVSVNGYTVIKGARVIGYK